MQRHRQQLLNGIVALSNHINIAQRAVQPAPQHAACHWATRAIQDAEQGMLDLSIKALIQFQMPARCSIHGNGVIRGFPLQRI